MIKNKYALSWISITSTVQFFSLLLFIVFTITVFNYPNDKFGFSIFANDWLNSNWIDGNSFEFLLKENGWIIFYQSFVFISIGSFVLFFLMEILSILNFYKLKGLDDLTHRKYLIYSIFGFVMFWKWHSIAKKNAKLNPKENLKTQIFGNINTSSINHQEFWSSIKNFKLPTNKTMTTGFFYLLLMSSSFGFIIIWISYGFQFSVFETRLAASPINSSNIGDFESLDILQRDFINLSPFTSTLTYYTQLTNFACFAYALITLFKPKANIFRNNTLTIQLGTYIMIVGVVYWLVLFDRNGFVSNDPMINSVLIPSFISTSIIHGVTPFSFFLYLLVLINFNRIQPVKYWKSFNLFLIYPLSYGMFLYLVPVFSVISIYGVFSNINPNNTIGATSTEVGTSGNPIWLLGIIVLAIGFSFTYFIIWIYASLITKKPILKLTKN